MKTYWGNKFRLACEGFCYVETAKCFGDYDQEIGLQKKQIRLNPYEEIISQQKQLKMSFIVPTDLVWPASKNSSNPLGH